MLLCVDVGNTMIKFSLADGREIGTLDAIDSRKIPGAARIRRLLPREHQPDDVVVCSVVPSINRPLARALRAATGRKPMIVDHKLRWPFRLAVRRPETVGTDRLCAAAGAVGRSAGVIVIDVGSAITVDIVEAGRYKGGPIMIGPGLALRALGDHAVRLPKISEARLGALFSPRAGSTERSMVHGAGLAAIGAMREAVRAHERKAGRRLGKVITGGGAESLLGRLPPTWRYDPHLVARGLVRVWKLNE